MERLSSDSTLLGLFNFYPWQEKSDQKATLEALLHKGNDGLGCHDPHTCCLCQKIVASRGGLKAHLEMFRCQALFCDLCPKIFFSEKDLCTHKKTVHNLCKKKKKFECEICKTPVVNLRIHLRIHRPRVNCPVCKKSISNYTFAKHLEGHASKDYKCQRCDEAFDRKEKLRR